MEVKKRNRRKVPIKDRFWPKVIKGVTEDDCWDWAGCFFKSFGYAAISVNNQAAKAHRVSWEIHNGPIPENANVLHKCDNPRCTNPRHLFLGTIADNNRDKWEKGRHGKFTPEKVRRIRALYEKYKDVLTFQRIADWFGVAKATISHMITGRNWSQA